VIAVSNKVDQQAKHLRLQLHRSIAAAQLKALRVEPIFAERLSHARA
jgi:hypothetical protein